MTFQILLFQTPELWLTLEELCHVTLFLLSLHRELGISVGHLTVGFATKLILKNTVATNNLTARYKSRTIYIFFDGRSWKFKGKA